MMQPMPVFAPAIVAARQHELVRAFHAAGALDPTRARSPREVGVREDLVLRGLVRRGVLGATEGGRFWLDVHGWERWRRARFRAALVLLALILLGLALVLTTAG